MGPKRLMILTATNVEARAVARGLGLKRQAGRRSWRNVERPGIELQIVGVGGVCPPEFIPGPPVEWIILAGLAGGLDPALDCGDLVLDAPPHHYRPLNAYRTGSIHTVRTIVATPAEKAALFASTGAAAVDMESALLKPLAAARGAGFIDVRVILDTAAESLSPDLCRLVDPFGRAKPGAVAALLLRDPRAIRRLLRLRRSSCLALKKLESAIVGLVDHLRS